MTTLKSKRLGRQFSLVAIDVDGTLFGAKDGIITGVQIRRLLYRRDVIWGIVSSRSIERSIEICNNLRVTPHFVWNCRIIQRAEELRALAKTYSNPVNPSGFPFLMPDNPICDSQNVYAPLHKIYVADTNSDRIEAEAAGFEFYFPQDFPKIRLNEPEDMGEMVKTRNYTGVDRTNSRW